MIEYKDIESANKQITTVEIKNNDYASVSERVKAFRKICPNGTIDTQIISHENGKIIMTARVFDDCGNLLGSGTAYEIEGNGYINKTSYIENCETSAVGRALGFCGLGIDAAIASAEEQQNAVYQQDQIKAKEKKVTKAVAQSLHDRCGGDEGLEAYMLKGCGVEAWADMTNEVFERVNREWNTYVKKYKEASS